MPPLRGGTAGPLNRGVWSGNKRIFAQLFIKEYYGVITQVEEQVLFQISYRTDITTANVITYKGVDYEITRIDTFEGYKENLVLYCKVKS